ncbi:hypothetical protein RND81_14G175200 [Saponaria officinalis]|uniref:RRM domain-containing protein n=1 Tax=Saponaria officinalis TaxID=3572 RepID=A0AAW1GRD0_SAPOF
MVAHEQRRLVTINNLDPSYTSSDVQDVISSAFNLKVDAKIIPRRSFSNTLHGQALVIFNSMDEANFVISELNKKCLVDGEGRPIVAVKTKLVDLPKRNHFPGHIALELHEIKKRTSKAKTVSTSHCAQQNTCESKMAMEWILFHQRADFWCKTLHEEQEKEIDACLNKLKSRQPSEYTKVCGKNSKPVVEVQIKKESALCWKDRNHGQSIQPNKNSKPAVKLRIKKRKCTLFKGQ